MNGYIYKVTNLINNKIYIGQTINNVKYRWSAHCSSASKCKALSASIATYGKDSFKVETLEVIEAQDKVALIEKLNLLEIKYIKEYSSEAPNGYNLSPGGDRLSFYNRVSTKGKKRGKYKQRTAEELAKNAERNSKTHLKPIKCNETGQVWNSVKECAEFFGVKPKQISRVLKGQRKHLRWKYSFSYLPKNKT
jgi:group I intron endonuclease